MQTGPSDHRDEHGDGEGPKLRDRRRRPRSGRRRALSYLLKFSGLVIGLAILAGVALGVRLSMGPMAIDGIGDQIAGALHDRFGKDLRFTLGKTAIVQRGLAPTLTVDRLSVTAPGGEPILDAPRAEVSIDPVSLIFGKVVPKRLEVFGITLRLVVLENGHLAVAAGAGAKPFFEIGADAKADSTSAAATAPPSAPDPASLDAAGKPRRAVLVKQASAAIRQAMDALTDPNSALAAVERLGISHGALVIEDRKTQEQTSYKDLDLAFDRRHGQTSFDLSAEGPTRRWTIDALASGSPHAERHFAMKIANLSMDEIALATGSRSIGVDTDAPIGAHLDIGLKADDTLSEATGGFDLGEGFLRDADPDQEPLLITTIDGGFRWNATDRSIEIQSLRYIEHDTHLIGAGTVRPPHNEGDPWAFDIATSEPSLFAPDRKGQEPISVESGALKGRLFLDQQRVFIDQMSLKTALAGMAALGQIDWIDGPHIRFGISMDPAPVKLVKRIWPSAVASPVRAWMLSHFQEGTVRNARLKIDYNENDLKRMRADRAPSDSSVALDFDVFDGRVAFLDGVPPLQNVVGSAHITGRTSRFNVSSGNIETDGKKVDLADGVFAISNANIHPIMAKVSARVSSSAEAVAAVLSLDALKPYGPIPLDPASLHGRVEGRLDKTIYLGTEDDARDVLKVDAKVTNFSAERLVGKEDLEDATVDVAVDAGKLKASGQGRIFGGPATFEINRTGFGTPTAALSVTLDDAARAKLGLSAVQGLSGPVVAHVNTSLGDPTKMKAQIELDLAKANIAAAYLGLSKPTGRPGKIAFNLSSNASRMIIDSLNADIGAFQAHGAIDLAPDNSFQGAHFSSLKISPGDDMKLDVAKNDDGYKLTIRGSTIDARPFLKAVTSTPKDDSTPIARSAKAEKREVESLKGVDIDLKSAILTGFNKEAMTGVDLKLSKRGSAFKAFSVQGHFGRHNVTSSMNASQRIKVVTDDAGALVSFIDLYKHMESGLLTATLQLDDDDLSGNLEIHEFVLRDEPAIRRLVAQSAEVSAPGADAAAARRIDGGAVRFNRLKVNFQREGSQLELRDAAMSGPDIGLSVDGWLDYSHDRVDMKGTFVPAFALNNLFSQIPVFGVFLGGKSNEGLLAITFRITGLASSPTLNINPLSAVTPGILRNIFGALDDAAQGQGRRSQFPAEPSR